MSDNLKHSEGATPETDPQTEARLATVEESALQTDASTTDSAVPSWLLPSKAYSVLKWLTLTVLPALAVLVGALGAVWGLPHLDAFVTTINAVALFLGATIGVSAIKAKTA